MNVTKQMIPSQWLLLVGLLLGININIWAQVTPDIPKSPDVASLEKYADIPVGHYTGIPNISVPICNLKSRSLSVPISLSYHYTGFKPNEIPGWVGLGWTLNAGGMITRTVQGLPDELPNGYHNNVNSIKDTYDHFNNLTEWNFLREVHEGTKDSQPDMYSFNVGGYTGKFFLEKIGTDYKAHLIPHQNIKIDVVDTLHHAWKITTPDGNIYEFGGEVTDGQGVTTTLEEVTVSASIPASGQGTIPVSQHNIGAHTSAWYLKSVTSPNGDDRIDFYYNAKVTNIELFSQTENYRFPLVRYVEGSEVQCEQQQLPYVNNVTTTIGGRLHLKEIVTSVGHKVTFTEGLERDDFADESLAEVKVYALNNQLVKRIKLSYNYLANGSYKRLLLSQVQEVSPYANSTEAKGAYRFKYHLDGLGAIDPLFEKGIDYWGYYNGANNQYLIPSYINVDRNINFSGANRSINPEKVKIGVMTEMSYPTGGKAHFTWEPHQYQSGGCNELGTLKRDSIVTQLAAFSAYDVNNNGEPDSSAKEITIHIDEAQPVTIFAENRKPLDDEGNLPIALAIASTQIFTPIDGDTTNLEEVFSYTGHIGANFTLLLKAGTYIIRCMVLAENNLDVSAYIRLKYMGYKLLDQSSGCEATGPGIRIAKVVMSDGLNTGNDIVKEYQYRRFHNPGQPSGVMVLPFPTVWHEYQITQVTNDGCLSCLFFNISSQTKLPTGYSKGNPIVYTDIRVNHGESGVNGHEEYEYTFRRNDLYFYKRNRAYELDQFIIRKHDNLFAQTKDYDWKNGHLSQQRTYDAHGRILNKTINHYLSSDEGGERSDAYKGKVLVARMITALCDEGYQSFSDMDYSFFELESAWHRLDRTENIQYVYDKNDVTTASQRPITTQTKYYYDNPQKHVFVTRTEVTDSEGRVQVTNNRYPQDILPSEPKLYAQADSLKSKNMIGSPLVSYTLSDDKILGATYQEYQTLGNKIYPMASYITEFATPLSNHSDLYSTDVYDNFVNFQRKQQYVFEPSTGNVKQVTKEDDLTTTFIWGYNQTLMTAQVVNATEQQVFYSSFEQGNDMGRWDISAIAGQWTLSNAEHYTGNQALLVTGGEVTIESQNLSAIGTDEVYQLSFWKKGAGEVTVTGAPNLAPAKTLESGWSLYVVKIPRSNMAGGIVELKVPAGVYLDELRLHPELARMKTFTHLPLIGVSSATDDRNVTAYYEYDALNRLKLVRDFEGNILKRYTYKYKD